MVCMQHEITFAALIQACHRALDDLRWLDAAKPIVCIDVGRENGQAASGECILRRWRSTESGYPEERCFILRVA